jgi:hypothetical protein
MRSLVICNRLRQFTSWMTISMPTIATKNLHRTMLPRSEAINAKQIVPIITTGKISPVIQLSGIEDSSPLSAPFWCAQKYFKLNLFKINYLCRLNNSTA